MTLRLGVAFGLAVAAGLAGVTGLLRPAWAAAGVATSLGLVLVLVGVASARPELRWFGPAIVRANHPGAAVLTFDDGPHPESTPALLAALRAVGARATFFVLADRVEAWPELLAAIVADGHEVGLHGSAHHPWLTTWSPERGARDLRAGLDVLARHGVHTRWFRPPFGAVSPRLYEAVGLAGLELVWCSVRTGDGGRLAPDTLRARCRDVVGTDIVLLHEGAGRLAATLLPELLEEWASRGIRAVTLSEGLAR